MSKTQSLICVLLIESVYICRMTSTYTALPETFNFLSFHVLFYSSQFKWSLTSTAIQFICAQSLQIFFIKKHSVPEKSQCASGQTYNNLTTVDMMVKSTPWVKASTHLTVSMRVRSSRVSGEKSSPSSLKSSVSSKIEAEGKFISMSKGTATCCIAKTPRLGPIVWNACNCSCVQLWGKCMQL